MCIGESIHFDVDHLATERDNALLHFFEAVLQLCLPFLQAIRPERNRHLAKQLTQLFLGSHQVFKSFDPFLFADLSRARRQLFGRLQLLTVGLLLFGFLLELLQVARDLAKVFVDLSLGRDRRVHFKLVIFEVTLVDIDDDFLIPCRSRLETGIALILLVEVGEGLRGQRLLGATSVLAAEGDRFALFILSAVIAPCGRRRALDFGLDVAVLLGNLSFD